MLSHYNIVAEAIVAIFNRTMTVLFSKESITPRIATAWDSTKPKNKATI